MTFYEIYKRIESVEKKRAFRKKIINACMIEPGSFYTWITRKKVSPLAQLKIAEVLEKPIDELFPTEKENELSIN